MADKQIDEKTLRTYYRQTLVGEAGATVLKDIENRCFKRDSTFDSHLIDASKQTFINEGKRQVLLYIENMMSDEGIANLAEEPEKERE